MTKMAMAVNTKNNPATEKTRGKALTRILIVEDESIVAMDLSEQLEAIGYEVCGLADNGADAIAITENQQPDLILMDIVIKGPIDGIETAQKINQHAHIPVIFLTAYTDNTTVERAAKVAPYGYVSKPYQPRELRAAIEVALYKAKLENSLRESELWFSTTLRCVGDAVVATDADQKIKFMNPAAEAFLGYTLEEVDGRDVDDIMQTENPRNGMALESFASRAIRENKVVGIEFGTLLINKNGKKVPIDDSAAPIRSAAGKILGAVIAFRDVSARLAAEAALRNSEERFRKAFSFAPVGMALVGMNSRFLQVNEALCKLLGLSEEQLLKTYESDITFPEDIARERPYINQLLTGRNVSVQFEKRYQSSDTDYVWVLASASLLMQNEQPFCYLYQIHDLTERKQAELRLDYLAHYDTLTGLANRAKFMQEVEVQILAMKRQKQHMALIFLDLDHFKQVNDSLGHEAGDDLLKIVAERLRSAVRETDLVARLGGDEFVVLMPNISSEQDVSVVANKIWVQFQTPVILGNQEVNNAASMGASIYPEDGEDAKTLLRCADSALYHAKSEGRNNLQFYRLELTSRLSKKLRLEHELKHALLHNEFELYYQPIVPVSASMPKGAEALIRWNHPQRGLVLPDEFIPTAEETGLIVPIGKWVMQQACREASAWQASGQQAVGVSVNVSALQFKQGNVRKLIKDCLAESGLPPQLLTIEITEQLMLQNTEQNLKLISDIKQMGVQIAIDDFGIGYSSLSYIKRFSPNKLKIDRSFVRDLSADPEDDAIVRAIIAMSRSLNIKVVAEGVETTEQLNFLQNERCDLAQGYYYSTPCTAQAFRDWLQSS